MEALEVISTCAAAHMSRLAVLRTCAFLCLSGQYTPTSQHTSHQNPHPQHILNTSSFPPTHTHYIHRRLQSSASPPPKRIKFMRGLAESTDFEDAAFDLVVFSFVIHECPQVDIGDKGCGSTMNKLVGWLVGRAWC